MIQFRTVNKIYNTGGADYPVLKSISFGIEKGEYVVMIMSSLITSIISGQTWQIGILKAIGGDTGKITKKMRVWHYANPQVLLVYFHPIVST